MTAKKPTKATPKPSSPISDRLGDDLEELWKTQGFETPGDPL